jgi:ribosomal 50S subunit-recycling heat shock protein
VLRNFAALSQGDHIDITFDATTYHFEVTRTTHRTHNTHGARHTRRDVTDDIKY